MLKGSQWHMTRDGYRQKNHIVIYHDTGPAYRDTYHDTYHKIQLKCENGSSVFSTKISTNVL